MKRSVWFGFVIWCVCSASLVLFQAQPPAQAATSPTGTLRGTIQAARLATNSALQVLVIGPDGQRHSEFVAASGRYQFDDLPFGHYQVVLIDQAGTLVEQTQTNLTSSAAVTLRLGQTRATTASVCAPGALTGGGSGTITGIVSAADTNQPLSGGRVYLYTIDGFYVSDDFLSVADNGRYRFADLPPGDYLLRFDMLSTTPYADEWYNDQTEQRRAAAVSVLNGQSTTINASLLPLKQTGAIGGLVSAANNSAALPNGQVEVYSSNGSFLRSTTVSASGTYTVTGLATGNYYVYFVPPENTAYIGQWAGGFPSRTASISISVTAPNLSPNVNASLALGGLIRGRVTDSQGQAIANLDLDFYDSNNTLLDANAKTDPNGVYTVTTGLATGNYKVRFDADETMPYLDEYYNDKPDRTSANLVAVTAGQITNNIDAQLAPGYRIIGQVTGEGGGLPDVYVDVYQSSTGRYLGDAVTDNTGNFTAPAVVSGDYQLDIYPRYFDGSCEYTESSRAVTIAGADVTGVQINLSRGAVFRGRVTDADGLGMQDVYVAVYDLNQNVVSYSYTNASGGFVTYGVAPNASYKLRFSRGGTPSFGPVFYNNKPTFALADPITVGAAGSVQLVNVSNVPQFRADVYLPLITR